MMKITPIPAFNDNYIWLLTCQDHLEENQNRAWVVDPGDAAPVLKALDQQALSLAGILITHHHADHTGGISQLLQHFPVPVIGPANSNINGISQPVCEDDEIEVLGTTFRVISVPGHTLDHIAYFSDSAADQPTLFCGDTLFAGGCGRLFEGTPETMLLSLKKLAALPENTQVFCAHEYTTANLCFAVAVEPDNEILQQRVVEVQQLRQRETPSVPSTLAQEKATNPFLRASVPAVISAAKNREKDLKNDEASVFKVIRKWKDCF